MNKLYCQLLMLSLCLCPVFSQFNCFDCTGGPLTNCGSILSRDLTSSCRTQCYEAYIEYQNGALPLIQRRCWEKPRNSNASSYCEWFRSSQVPINTNARMISCRSCKTDRCNGNKSIGRRVVVPAPSRCS
ncbi:unnamed protein product [Psylliodes chrysocephalus]|uniref:Uncharacterized protein n=1 Tax=Psylliodes chrysocephalus TaxID=3402493 RepID=A0A9P0D168_9CUCU|nr:unnamed protein product [Psylliodes chrysocephala]